MIEVFISSVVRNLESERDAALKFFRTIPMVRTIGVDPFNDAALNTSSRLATLEMAESCHLYVLLLGSDYGWVFPDIGRSATEIEYESAVRRDPTKVLAFRKTGGAVPDEAQAAFIGRVRDYSRGYWVTDFDYSHTLQDKLRNSFEHWLTQRVALNPALSYPEHFVRLALQRRRVDFQDFQYAVNATEVHFQCTVLGNMHGVRFARSRVRDEFWLCVSELESEFDRWH